jgi:cyclopropane-fatty-acyl-phospholipid synthase
MWVGLLDNILKSLFQRGQLTVVFPDGAERIYGIGDEMGALLQLNTPDVIRRLVLEPELTVGEGYMDGSLSIGNDDLKGFLELCTANVYSGDSHWFMELGRRIREPARWLKQHNPVGKAQANVAHHYDLSEALYELFLDTDRQYSCAYFREPNMTLEAAQEAKKHHIARKLLLEPEMKVLDIGCGWGGMGLTLARDYGARVVGVTLSKEQLAVAKRRAEDEGLADRVDFRLQDYRHVDEEFDRVVSVGMFEHVGVPHYREYFRHLREFLTPDGVALIHTIGRGTPPGTTNPWIRKYIFPGGYIPAMSEVTRAIEKERLVIADVEVLRLHYAETLKHWYQRFSARIDEARALYDERFCRMWRFYLLGSEMVFRHGGQSVFQFQIVRDMEAAPLTRDYLYQSS